MPEIELRPAIAEMFIFVCRYLEPIRCFPTDAGGFLSARETVFKYSCFVWSQLHLVSFIPLNLSAKLTGVGVFFESFFDCVLRTAKLLCLLTVSVCPSSVSSRVAVCSFCQLRTRCEYSEPPVFSLQPHPTHNSSYLIQVIHTEVDTCTCFSIDRHFVPD